MTNLDDELLDADAFDREDVTDGLPPKMQALLKAKGKRLFVQDLPGTQRDEVESERVRLSYADDGKLKRTVNERNMRARLVARCLVDETGVRVFADAEKLGAKMSGRYLDVLFEKASVVCGMAKRAPLKNDPGGDSSTGSPNGSVGEVSAGDFDTAVSPAAN